MPVMATYRLLAAALLAGGAFAADSALSTYIVELKRAIPRTGSNAFVAPSAADRAKFVDCVEQLLGANPGSARACLESVHYELAPLESGGRTYWIASEKKDGLQAQGTYIVDAQYERNLVLETPHPIFDTGTLEEAAAVMERVGARALFVPGTHRCANSDTPSGCDGRTNSCGGQNYRISDAAHYVGNFFTAAHEATLRLAPQPLTISVHGSAGEPVDAEFSDGTVTPAPADAVVNRLRFAMEKRGARAGSCNWPADDPRRFRLCGGTNVQGRMTNGSTQPCTVGSKLASGLFVHVEQARAVRTNPDYLAGAILDAVPPVR
jgi:hypothetical protein